MKSSYSQWSLRKQLHVIFITSYVIVISLFILTALLQLNWLQTDLETKSYSVIKHEVKTHMRTLLKSQIVYTSSKFETLSSYLSFQKTIIEVTLGFSAVSNNYFDSAYAINSATLAKDAYNMSFAYYSRSSQLSSEGEEIVEKLAGLNPIMPELLNEEMFRIYQGFYTDDIINFCPLSYFDDSEYSPLSREWFYKAVENAPTLIVTEPYYDASGEILLITGSTAIFNGDEIVGVAGIDVTVEQFSSKVSELRILDNGKVFMVSAGGVVLNPPSEWETTKANRIYNESLTGVSYSKWKEIKSYSAGTIFELDITNFGPCLIAVDHFLNPFDGSIIYYMFAIVKISETKESISYVSDSFNTIHQVLIWSTSIISIVFLLGSLVVIYFSTKKVSLKLGEIKKILDSIIFRAYYANVVKDCNFSEADKVSPGIKKLLEGCKERVKELNVKEEYYKHYHWKTTRPSNFNMFNRWRDKIYPFNKYNGKVESWERAIEHIHNSVG